jgi:hypothetical protein
MTMTLRVMGAAGALMMAAMMLFGTAPASALGLLDCSNKYSAMKAAGKAGKMTFEEFQTKECGDGAKPAAAPTAAAKPAEAKTSKKKAKEAVVAAPAAKGPVTGPVFPTALSASAKGKKPSKARLATCVEQYRANKAANANGGLKWIQKGGGYWSQCNKKMKEIKPA